MASLYTSLAPLLFNFAFLITLVPSLLYMQKEDEDMIVKANLRSLVHFDGWRILFKLSNMAYVCLQIVTFWYYATSNANGLYLCHWMIIRC